MDQERDVADEGVLDPGLASATRRPFELGEEEGVVVVGVEDYLGGYVSVTSLQDQNKQMQTHCY